MENKFEQLLFTVLGAALVVKDKLETGNEEMKAWQEKSEAQARELLSDMAERGEGEREKLKSMFKQMFKEVIEELNLATKEDLEQLKHELGK
ncbi:MAG: hypothetical protein ACYDAI_15115 [Trichloromonadaceae bacterium]